MAKVERFNLHIGPPPEGCSCAMRKSEPIFVNPYKMRTLPALIEPAYTACFVVSRKAESMPVEKGSVVRGAECKGRFSQALQMLKLMRSGKSTIRPSAKA